MLNVELKLKGSSAQGVKKIVTFYFNPRILDPLNP